MRFTKHTIKCNKVPIKGHRGATVCCEHLIEASDTSWGCCHHKLMIKACPSPKRNIRGITLPFLLLLSTRETHNVKPDRIITTAD